MKNNHLYTSKLSAPVNVTWELTKRCNLSCRHCLSTDIRQDKRNDLSLKRCLSILDHLHELQVFQISIGGGEPFLREDLIEILEYAHYKNMVTCVSTNGTIMTPALAQKLAQMDKLFIQVSLDGATEQTNDYIRSPGHYQKALQTIELLNKYSFKNLSINTVINRLNFQEVPELHNLCGELRAKPRFSRFRPAGNAQRVWQEMRMDQEQLLQLSSYLNKHKDILTGDSFFFLESEERKHLGLNMCGAAKMTCSITPTGDIYPCAFLQDEKFYSGNILEHSLKDIWENSPVFETFRNLKVESCVTCPRFDICHGGCPAVAFFLSNQINIPDPECIYHLQGEINSSYSHEIPAPSESLE